MTYPQICGQRPSFTPALVLLVANANSFVEIETFFFGNGVFKIQTAEHIQVFVFFKLDFIGNLNF